jgi:hypothetical protein
MSILRTEAEPAPQFPLVALPPAFRTWVSQAAEAKGCPVDYVVTGLLSGGSGTIGNARRVSPWSGWVEPCCLWGVAVGAPSSGKSPGADAVLDALRALDASLASEFPDQLRIWEAAKAAAAERREVWKADVKEAVKRGSPPPDMPTTAVEPPQPVRPRGLVNDPTVESMAPLLAGNVRGVLLHRDELSGWLGTMNKYGGDGDRSFWLEAFGGRPYVVDRKKHPEPIAIPSLLVSVLGGIQPDKLASLIETDDGLAARFNFYWPAARPPVRPSVGIDEEFIRTVFHRLRGLEMVKTDGEAKPRVLPLAADAVEVFDAWRQDHAKTEADVSGLALSAYGKMPGMLLRLALVLELLAWSASNAAEPSAVGQTAVKCAAALVDGYFKIQARRVTPRQGPAGGASRSSPSPQSP